MIPLVIQWSQNTYRRSICNINFFCDFPILFWEVGNFLCLTLIAGSCEIATETLASLRGGQRYWARRYTWQHTGYGWLTSDAESLHTYTCTSRSREDMLFNFQVKGKKNTNAHARTHARTPARPHARTHARTHACTHAHIHK